MQFYSPREFYSTLSVGMEGFQLSVLGEKTSFFHVYECLTKNWLWKQTVPEVLETEQPLVITGLQYNASGVCGDLCSTCRPQHLFISNIQFAHLLFHLELFCMCQWQKSEQPEPSGPSRKVPGLLRATRTFGHRSACKLASQHCTTCPSYSECHGFVYLFVCLFNVKWGCLLFLWVPVSYCRTLSCFCVVCLLFSLFFLPSQDHSLSSPLSHSTPHLLLSSSPNPCIPTCMCRTSEQCRGSGPVQSLR